ncbi:MAG: AmmeMemoRadiSam system radical SAM enzyme [Blautia sp.]|nr:AmmeMemoRadiSam system radical SAM enzyme [Blautia sp.]
MPTCSVCFHHCSLKEGQRGLCLARGCIGGEVIPLSYGKCTALALDPIEKKPLNRFHPGSMILSYGSFGCNLRCPFCQNHDISYGQALQEEKRARDVTPEELIELAISLKARRNIGIAFTYNEPLTTYEYIYDCAVLAKKQGLKTVLVTNGTASLPVLEKILPYMDAMNIDLKGFREEFYTNFLKGSLPMVKDFISLAAKHCHVELTTLLIPGENDSEEEMREMTSWIASLSTKEGTGKDIPLHLSRFFPRFHLMDRPPTDVGLVYHLCEVAREKLTYVYPGNC